MSNEGVLLAVETNGSQMDHAAWLHTAISRLLSENGYVLYQVTAVAICSGPGSYTGLRVAMAAAKGLCYALSIPLITETSLKLTALRAQKLIRGVVFSLPWLICPMVDARRMEVFTTLFDEELNGVITPQAMILTEKSFAKELETHNIVFCGNGMIKWKSICRNPNAMFLDAMHQPADLAEAAIVKLRTADFTNLAYSEPDYLKNVYTGHSDIRKEIN